ncbi:hypothetical protein [Parenemella sanctibonifatiensis]|uniref:Uncharacterized protein n=1 Tax=Parenemella sanctibonifatiensis TaxID=2016505 RepID=A0A255EMC2_9ACTN|nr:hypothetical protein [Parenemella sanctibonifatiensis]OYN92656.1 hypothetical protein CGZ91_04075 [Parenemella sanctibonifatiensis]
MFSETGVTKPDLDINELNSRGSTYDTLTGATTDALSTVTDAVRAVLAKNKGASADAFKASVTRGGSIVEHLSEVSQAGQRTAAAYAGAASGGGSVQTAMVAVATTRRPYFWKAVMIGDHQYATKLLDATRKDLQRLEATGTRNVTQAFSSLNLPQPLPLGYGATSIDPRIEDDWRKPESEGGMSDEEKKDFLQQMADDYARENGFPPIEIDWNAHPGSLGVYIHPDTLKVDPANLDDPGIMETVIHEMQHRRQHTGYKAFRFPWQDEKNGMSREEAERWKRLNDDYVRGKGDDPNTPNDNEAYWERPVEVDAREAASGYMNDFSYDEYQKRKDPNYQPPTGGGTGTTDFHPPTWSEQGGKVDSAAQEFYITAEPVITMRPFAAKSNSPIESAAVAGDASCLVPWHRIVAGAKEGMTTVGSKMIGTGNDYSATEEDNASAAGRFWV